MIKLMRIQGSRSDFDGLVTECDVCGVRDADVYVIAESAGTGLEQAWKPVSPYMCSACFGRMARQKEMIDVKGGCDG